MAVVAPAVEEAGPVVIRALLIPFAVLAGYFVAWGVVFCMDALIRAFFGTVNGAVGWIPFLGNLVETPLHRIEQKLTSFLGGLEAQFEHQMATRWHQLAQLFERWAADAEQVGIMEWQLARSIYHVWTNLKTGVYFRNIGHWISNEISRLHGVQRVIVNRTTVIERTIVEKGKAGAVTITKPLAAELAHVIDIDLPRIKARDRAIEDELSRLWKWAHRKTGTVASGIALGALAYALGKLGLGWTRCSNWKRIGKNVCGAQGVDVPDFLAALLAVETLANFRELVKAAQVVEHGVANGVKDLLEV